MSTFILVLNQETSSGLVDRTSCPQWKSAHVAVSTRIGDPP